MPRSRKPALLLLLLAITSTHAFLLPHLHTSSCLRQHHSKQPTRRLSLRSISTPPLHGSSSADEEADVATLQANEGWVEPWAGTESSDLVRIVFDCYEKDKMVIDPWLLSELLLETGAYSSQIEDAAKDTKDETPIFGEHGEPACSEKIWNRSLVMADYGLEVDVGGVLALVKAAFELCDTYPLKYRLERIIDRDWQKEVQEGWKPILLGDRLVVKFTWHNEEDMAPFLLSEEKKMKVMTLEGGAAFGSGEHPTTHMCCAWLQEWLEQHALAGGREVSVCDYGAGSGILALAALMFGASTAVGVEIDPFAIQSAYRNAAMNGLETVFLLPVEKKLGGKKDGDTRAKFLVVRPAGNEKEEEEMEMEEVNITPTDVMLANILKRPLIELSKQISGLTKLGGKVVLAGLLVEQAESVMEAYRRYFPDIHQANSMGEWALLVGTRNNEPVVFEE